MCVARLQMNAGDEVHATSGAKLALLPENVAALRVVDR